MGKEKKENEGRDGKEGKGSGRERKWDLFGQYVEKGESTQEERKVVSLLPGRKKIFLSPGIKVLCLNVCR